MSTHVYTHKHVRGRLCVNGVFSDFYLYARYSYVQWKSVTTVFTKNLKKSNNIKDAKDIES